MKKHTKLYLSAMGYDESDFICCEIIGCGAKAVDLNHIECRGMGGSKSKDYIENLMAMCRTHHHYYGDKSNYKDFLRWCHLRRMQERNVSFNHQLIQTDYVLQYP